MTISPQSRRIIDKTHPDTAQKHVSLTTEVLRKGGLGIQGTYNNIAHHAQGMDEYVDPIAEQIRTMGLKKWRQGHNVHVFETKDGRIFEMVGVLIDDNEYCGIRLNLRLNRSDRVYITQVTDQNDIPEFLNTVRNIFAQPHAGTYTKKDLADCK